MPTSGRGGAGNIFSEAQIEESNRKLAEDLEASRPLASSAALPASSEPLSEYAHMGRGGAGNWYQPSELEQTGTFASTITTTLPSSSTSSTSSNPSSSTSTTAATDSTAAPPTASKPAISTPWHPPNVEMPIARAGRGGAGNFVWESEEDKKRKVEAERNRLREAEEAVVRDVEKGLKMPEKVVLGGVKGGRGW